MSEGIKVERSCYSLPPDNTISRRQFLRACFTGICIIVGDRAPTPTPDQSHERGRISNLNYTIDPSLVAELRKIGLSTESIHDAVAGYVRAYGCGTSNLTLAFANLPPKQFERANQGLIVFDINNIRQHFKPSSYHAVIRFITYHAMTHACMRNPIVTLANPIQIGYTNETSGGEPYVVEIIGFAGAGIVVKVSGKNNNNYNLMYQSEEGIAQYLAMKLEGMDKPEPIGNENYNRVARLYSHMVNKGWVKDEDLLHVSRNSAVPDFIRKLFNVNRGTRITADHYLLYIEIFTNVYGGYMEIKDALKLIQDIRNGKIAGRTNGKLGENTLTTLAGEEILIF